MKAKATPHKERVPSAQSDLFSDSLIFRRLFTMKKLLAAILAVSIVFGTGSAVTDSANYRTAQAYASSEYTEGTYDVLTYKNYGGYIEISGCDQSAEAVAIPSEIDGVPVTRICDTAFIGCRPLTSLTIPDSIDSIDEFALMDCENLKEILVDENNPYFSSENGILFSEEKTRLCKYPAGREEMEYTIPDGVVYIEANAFYG